MTEFKHVCEESLEDNPRSGRSKTDINTEIIEESPQYVYPH